MSDVFVDNTAGVTPEGGPLSGVRVLEMASYISGPFAGSLLSELGAEVIKIEHPPNGDQFRGWGTASAARASFRSYNAGKSSICIDWRDYREWFHNLVATSDVMLMNFRPSTQRQLGLTYEDLRTINQGIIVCNISGFGKTAPIADLPCYDAVAQGLSGLMSLVTDYENPQAVGPPMADCISGVFACVGVLSAIIERQRTGSGRSLDISMVGSAMTFIRDGIARELLENSKTGKTERARNSQSYAFLGNDGKPFVIHLSSPEKFWKSLVEAVSRPELTDDDRFRTKDRRVAHYDELSAELQKCFSEGSREYWLSVLSEGGVPCGPMFTPKEAARNPSMFPDAPAEPEKLLEYCKAQWLDGMNVLNSRVPPALGADNERFGVPEFEK